MTNTVSEVGFEDPENMLRLRGWNTNDDAPITGPDPVYSNPNFPGMEIHLTRGRGISLYLNGKKTDEGFDLDEILARAEMLKTNNVKPNPMETALINRLNTLLQEQNMRMGSTDVTPVQDGTEDFPRIVQEIKAQKQRYALMMRAIGTEDSYAMFWYAVGRAGYKSPDQIRNAKRQYDTMMGSHNQQQDDQ